MRTVFLGLFLLFFAGSAWAANPLFTVSDVTVDVTAENAIEAREQAFAQAQVQAFKVLAQRMMSEGAAETLTPPDTTVISSLIQDFEVTEEKLSSTRYIGTYTFRFRDSEVKNYFGQQGVAYTDVTSRPVLVLPFYQMGGDTVLWSPRNEWLQAWNRARGLQGIVPLVVPIGDLMDVEDIGDSEALTYDDTKLARLLSRYNAGEAALLIAMPAGEGLSVQIYRTDRAGPEAVQGVNIDALPGETREQMFDRATRMVHEALQRNWKERTVASPQSTGRMQVRVLFSSLEQWAETQRALERVYGINEIILQSLSPNGARVDLLYQGDERRLRLALEQADITLNEPYLDAAAFEDGPVYELYLNRFRPGGGL